MFATFFKKRRLIKRLWKLRRAYVDIDDKQRATQVTEPSSFGGKRKNSTSFREFVDFKRWFYAILASLTLPQLETLLTNVDDQGASVGACILVDVAPFCAIGAVSTSTATKLKIDDDDYEVSSFFVKTFSRPEIEASTLVSPLPWCHRCRRKNEPPSSDVVCINPYHFGVVQFTDSATTTVQRLFSRCDEHHAYSEIDSSTSSTACCDTGCFSDTSGTCRTSSCRLRANNARDGSINKDFPSRCKRAWCHMAYWEHNVRVGNLISVDEPLAFCYYTLPVAPSSKASLNLAKLERPLRPDSVLRTRQKIGRGFLLYVANSVGVVDDDSISNTVWLHNRGPSTLFVRSNYLHDDLESAVRLPPGYTMLVHNFDCPKSPDDIVSARDAECRRWSTTSSADGPRNPPSVLISFSKCWGKNYSRAFITCCPCWVEVIFPF